MKICRVHICVCTVKAAHLHYANKFRDTFIYAYVRIYHRVKYPLHGIKVRKQLCMEINFHLTYVGGIH